MVALAASLPVPARVRDVVHGAIRHTYSTRRWYEPDAHFRKGRGEMAGQEQSHRDADGRLQVHETRGVDLALFAMRRAKHGRGWRSVLLASLLAVVALGAVLLRDSWLAHAGPSVYAQAVLTDTPTFYYRLDESSGTTMADSSGNAHNAPYQSGRTYGAPGALANEA